MIQENGMIQVEIEPKPKHVPLHYQPIYKVSQILLILNYNTGSTKSASISFLHTIAWAMRDKENEKILSELKGGYRRTLVPWCYEPALDKAVIIALVNGYCIRQAGGKIKLAEKGRILLRVIEKHSLFASKINLLKRLGEIPSDLIDSKQSWETN